MPRTSLTIRIVLRCVLLLPLALSSQMPPKPARLMIQSNPSGARITINGQSMSQRTDVTFLVSPGTYGVAVSGNDGNPNCAERKVQVWSGQTATLTCANAAWTVQ